MIMRSCDQFVPGGDRKISQNVNKGSPKLMKSSTNKIVTVFENNYMVSYSKHDDIINSMKGNR